MKAPKKSKAEVYEYLKKEYSNYDKSVKHEEDLLDYLDWLDEIYVSGEKQHKPIFGWLLIRDKIRDLVLIEL